MLFTQIHLPVKGIFPRKINGAVYNALKRDHQDNNPPFSIYVSQYFTEINFFEEDAATKIIRDIEASRFFVGNSLVKEKRIVSSITLEQAIKQAVPVSRLIIKFLTPTAIRQKEKKALLPLPSLFRKAKKFYPSNIQFDICHYEVETAYLKISDKLGQSGFVGHCVLRTETPNKDLYVLGRILEYTGVGWKTALGMGKVDVQAA
jgi:CRISPR-associated endoribonuclease Cas6